MTEETVASSASAVPEEDAADEAGPEEQDSEATQAPTAAPTEPPVTTAPTVPETVPETVPKAVPETTAATEPVLVNGKKLTEYSSTTPSTMTAMPRRPCTRVCLHPHAGSTPWRFTWPPAPASESEFTILRIIRSFRNDLCS